MVINRRARIAKGVNPYRNNNNSRGDLGFKNHSSNIKEQNLIRKSINKSPFFKNLKAKQEDRVEGGVNLDRLNHPRASMEENRYRISIKRKSSGRISEEPATHREKESIEDYSKVLKKLQKISISKDKAVRNQVHQLDVENEFMKNQGNRVYNRKSQCRRQPSQSKMSENEGGVKDRENILTISPTIGAEELSKHSRGSGSVKRDSRKYSNCDYESMNSLNLSEMDRSVQRSNAKIQMKNLNFLLRPNSALQSSSPNSIIKRKSLNGSEYPLPSLPSYLEDKIQHRPMHHSRSNSKLRGIQNRAYYPKKEGKRKSIGMTFHKNINNEHIYS